MNSACKMSSIAKCLIKANKMLKDKKHALQKITEDHNGNVTPLDSAGQHSMLLEEHSHFHYFPCTCCLIFITVWFCIFYSQETGGIEWALLTSFPWRPGWLMPRGTSGSPQSLLGSLLGGSQAGAVLMQEHPQSPCHKALGSQGTSRPCCSHWERSHSGN